MFSATPTPSLTVRSSPLIPSGTQVPPTTGSVGRTTSTTTTQPASGWGKPATPKTNPIAKIFGSSTTAPQGSLFQNNVSATQSSFTSGSDVSTSSGSSLVGASGFGWTASGVWPTASTSTSSSGNTPSTSDNATARKL